MSFIHFSPNQKRLGSKKRKEAKLQNEIETWNALKHESRNSRHVKHACVCAEGVLQSTSASQQIRLIEKRIIEKSFHRISGFWFIKCSFNCSHQKFNTHKWITPLAVPFQRKFQHSRIFPFLPLLIRALFLSSKNSSHIINFYTIADGD
jgi:hypothetical protein